MVAPPKGKDCSMPKYLDSTIRNTQEHVHEKRGPYSEGSLWNPRVIRTGNENAKLLSLEKMNMIKCSFA